MHLNVLDRRAVRYTNAALEAIVSSLSMHVGWAPLEAVARMEDEANQNTLAATFNAACAMAALADTSNRAA